MKFCSLLLVLFSSSFAMAFTNINVHSDEPKVCYWENPETHATSESIGYTFGADTFSTVEECATITRAGLMFLEDWVGSPNGVLTFIPPNGAKAITCTMTRLKSPYSAPSPEYMDVIMRAVAGADVKLAELMKHSAYLNENISVVCN
jgi:hypothetical protein